MSAVASQITSLTIVYLTVYSGADKKKTSKLRVTGFVRGINRWPVNSPHKGPVTRKMFPFDDVIMQQNIHRASVAELWRFIYYWHEQAVKTIELAVIWDTMMFMWGHCNIYATWLHCVVIKLSTVVNDHLYSLSFIFCTFCMHGYSVF